MGFAVIRLVLFGLQLLWLGRRTGPMGLLTAMGLSLVVYGFGAVTPAAPAEGMAIASRELRRRGRTKRQARLTVGFSEWFAQRTFYAVAALDLILVIVLGHLSLVDSWPFMIVAIVVIVAIAGTAVAARRPASAEWIMGKLAAIRIRRPQPTPEGRRQAAGAWHAEAMTVVGSPSNRARLALSLRCRRARRRRDTVGDVPCRGLPHPPRARSTGTNSRHHRQLDTAPSGWAGSR